MKFKRDCALTFILSSTDDFKERLDNVTNKVKTMRNENRRNRLSQVLRALYAEKSEYPGKNIIMAGLKQDGDVHIEMHKIQPAPLEYEYYYGDQYNTERVLHLRYAKFLDRNGDKQESMIVSEFLRQFEHKDKTELLYFGEKELLEIIDESSIFFVNMIFPVNHTIPLKHNEQQIQLRISNITIRYRKHRVKYGIDHAPEKCTVFTIYGQYCTKCT